MMTVLPLHPLKQFLLDHVFKRQTVKFVCKVPSQHIISSLLCSHLRRLCVISFSHSLHLNTQTCFHLFFSKLHFPLSNLSVHLHLLSPIPFHSLPSSQNTFLHLISICPTGVPYPQNCVFYQGKQRKSKYFTLAESPSAS